MFLLKIAWELERSLSPDRIEFLLPQKPDLIRPSVSSLVSLLAKE
jgi:hypothetical protein